MAHRDRFGFTLGFDGFEEGLENFFSLRLVAGEQRAIGYIIEAAQRRGRKLHHQRAPEDGTLMFENGGEVVVSSVDPKIRPPGRLHEAGIGSGFQKFVPRPPAIHHRGWR